MFNELMEKTTVSFLRISLVTIFLFFTSVVTVWSQESSIFILSSRFFHPRDQNDKAITLDAIDELNPNKIDWIYYENDAILDKYKEKRLPFSLTLNPQVADSLGYTSKSTRITDYNGKIYVAPWMKTWKVKNPYWGCVNNPNFKKLFLDKSLFLASKGPYALMVDDALFNARLKKEKLVGCFCDYCTEKYNSRYLNKTSKHKKNKVHFVKVLGKGSFDLLQYESFQEKSVVNFLKMWMKEVKKVYPKMLFYTNNFNGEWNQIYKTFDGGIAEIKENRINDTDLNRLYQNADMLHKRQVFTLDSENRNLQFKLLEYNIKNKRETMLPWDIMIVKQNRRFYLPLDTIKKMIRELEIKY